jgi:hypothetical protein
MAGAHMFQAVQNPELNTLGLVAIRDFLKKRARYLQLVAQNNKADGMLCAAEDETSVNTMRRMFCCNFLRKSRL